MTTDKEISKDKIPAIPPVDYKGSTSMWMQYLIELGLWNGKGWYGDVMISSSSMYDKILELCEN